MARAKNEEFNQIKYQNEFKKANYDRVEILVKKGERAIIKEIAAAAGQNVSEYINQAIKERMERDQRMTAEEQEYKKDYITTGAGLSNLEGIAPAVVI